MLQNEDLMRMPPVLEGYDRTAAVQEMDALLSDDDKFVIMAANNGVFLGRGTIDPFGDAVLSVEESIEPYGDLVGFDVSSQLAKLKAFDPHKAQALCDWIEDNRKNLHLLKQCARVS